MTTSHCSTLDLFSATPRAAAIDALHASTAIYTRDGIVEQLLDHVRWPQGDRSLIDTSCGDGVFLGHALDRLLVQQPEISGEALLRRISGWEIHFFAAAQACGRLRDVLVAHGRDPHDAARLAQSIVRCADFLTEGPQGRVFHLIVGNPPYLRFANVPDPLRTEYEGVLPDYARADLLHSFLDRCAALLHADGELAMVTADRWLFNAGAARLRQVVGRRFGLAHVERLDPASSFYRPKQRRAGTPPRIHPVAVVLRPAASCSTTIGRDPIFPGEAPYVAPSFQLTLGQVAEVRLAPWLGTPGVFLIDADRAAGLPAEYLVPAIDTDDIKQGHLGVPRRRAILTHPDRLPHVDVLAHLEREMPRMCARGRRRSPRWLPPETFHELDLSRESLLVPRIARTLVPVRVPAGVLPVNHNLSIVRSGRWTLDTIAQTLSSAEASEWMRHHAAPLENGYRSITTRLLRSLPMFGT